MVIEENTLIGGLGSAVIECLVSALGRDIPLIKQFGLPDQFPDKYGNQEQLLAYYGLTVDKLVSDIKVFLEDDMKLNDLKQSLGHSESLLNIV